MKEEAKQQNYDEVGRNIALLCNQESDKIAKMATIACELFHMFEQFHWVGFYRVVEEGLLKIGPYQGGHGCLAIAFDRGICGRCARTQTPQIINDVLADGDHIACSSTTRSEIVVPLIVDKTLIGVLDIDSDFPNQFDHSDAHALVEILRHNF